MGRPKKTDLKPLVASIPEPPPLVFDTPEIPTAELPGLELPDEAELPEEETAQTPSDEDIAAIAVETIKGRPVVPPPADAPQKGSTGRKKRSAEEEADKKRQAIAEAVSRAVSFYHKGVNRPVTNDDELDDRIDKFFNACARDAQIPTFEKLCLALGYTKSEVTAWETGTARGFSSRTGSIIRQAKLALSAVEADLVMQGQMQASVYQFRSKNYSGMKDQSETVVTPNTEPAAKSLAELLAASRALSDSQKRTYEAEYTDKADEDTERLREAVKEALYSRDED